MKPMVREIQRTTARHFGVPMQAMKARDKPGTPAGELGVLQPRHVAMFLAREITQKSYPLIAQRFWRKDHTTVIYAHRRVRRFLDNDPALAAKIEAIRTELAA